MLEQAAVALRRHDAEVDAEALSGDDRRLRVAVGDHLEHRREMNQVRGESRRVRRRSDQVEVAERLTAPPDAPRLGHAIRGGVSAQLLQQLADDGQARAEEAASRLALAHPFVERLDDLLLGLRAEPVSVRSCSASAAAPARRAW